MNKLLKISVLAIMVMPIAACSITKAGSSSATISSMTATSNTTTTSTPISSSTSVSINTSTSPSSSPSISITTDGAMSSVDNGVYPLGTRERPFSTGVCTSLNIYFMEMVQQYGDGIILKCGTAAKEDDFTMLIDVGQTSDGKNVMKDAVKNIADNEIDFAVFTHGHADHVAGFKNTVSGNTDTVTIKNFLDFGYVYSGTTYKTYYANLRNRYITEKQANYITAADAVKNKFGTATYYLAQDLTYEVLDTGLYVSDPNEIVKNERANNTSIVGILRYKDFSLFLSGDLDQESSLLSRNPELGQATLMKAGHHGSNTSNSLALLNILQPEGVIISAAVVSKDDIIDGSNNDHPNPYAIANFKKTPSIGDNIYLNMTMGTIDVNVDPTTLDYTITGSGATRLNYNSIEYDQDTEKNMKLENTHFYNDVVVKKYSKTLKQMVDGIIN